MRIRVWRGKNQEKKEKKKGNERRNVWMKKKKKPERIKNKIEKCYHNIFIILSQ